jgi:hypothetical protein
MPPANVGREVATAAVTGALSLVNPGDLSPRALTAYRVTCATLSGAFTYGVLRENDLTEHPRAQAAFAVGAATTVFATMGLWERWDAVVHRWLVARGVQRPRLVIAAAATATSLVSALDRNAPRPAGQGRGCADAPSPVGGR